MGIKEDYQKAITFAKQGKYLKARALLEPYKEHNKIKPTYDKLIERISEQPYGKFQLLPKKQRDSAYGCLGLLFFAFLCSMWLAFSNSEANPTEITDASTITGSLVLVGSDYIIDPYVDINVLNNNQREVVVTFVTDSPLEATGTAFGTVASACREFDIRVDTISLVIGDPSTDQTVAVISSSYADVIAFIDGDITVETWTSRMTVVDF